jgi:4-hydroxybenzoate polyprenyltransferase
LNGYFFGVLFLLGCLIISARLDEKMCMMTTFFILTMYPYEIIHEISHFENDKIEYAAVLLRRYIRQIYLLLFIGSTAACLLFCFLELNILFITASLLFDTAFFIIIFRIDRNKTFKNIGINRSRVILRYLGFFYGLLLWLSFIKRI